MAASPAGSVHRQIHRLFNLGAVGTMPDAQLVDQFATRRDDAAQAAFEELLNRHGPMVLRVCRGALHDAHDAEDAFQAVFLVLANRARSIRRCESVASWLFGVAQRVAQRSRRSATRRRVFDQLVASRTSEIDHPTENDCDWEILHDEIHGLPEQLRAPIVLCYLQGLTYQAAAQQLGCSAVTIRGRLSRARKRLRERLTRRGVTAPAGLLIGGAVDQFKAAIPESLIHSTSRIALGFAGGETATVLARGALNSMFMNQLKLVTVLMSVVLVGSYRTWQALAAVEKIGQTNPAKKALTVQLINPPVRNIVHVLSRPSFIEAFERTSIYPKLPGYVEKTIVDIGDKVKKGDVLCTLLVADLVEDHGAKLADGRLDKERITSASKIVSAADASVKAARARLDAAAAVVVQYEADVNRWDSEVERLKRVVDSQFLLESINRSKAPATTRDAAIAAIHESAVARDAARAAIGKVEADLLSCRASLTKAKVEVSLAAAALAVAESEDQRIKAWADYHILTAPYDGVIVARNANTFDFVQPETRTSTAEKPASRSPRGAALRDRQDRRGPCLRRDSRTGCQPRASRNASKRDNQGISEQANSGLRHADLMGRKGQAACATCRDRPAQFRWQAQARNVCHRRIGHGKRGRSRNAHCHDYVNGR